MSIYDTIGGSEAVEATVDSFYDKVLGDPLLVPYFVNTDMVVLKKHMRLFLAVSLGGARYYTGRLMQVAHADLAITDEAFDHVVDHLSGTLQELNVPQDIALEILDGLAPLRDDIVTA